MNVAVAERDLGRIALAYLDLTKPRIVFLVLLTGIPALLLAAGGWPDWRVALAAIGGTALAAASAAAFNHYFDRDIDALMSRTQRRPLPSGVLQPVEAVGFAFVLAGLAFFVLFTWANLLAAGIGMLSIVYYAVIYTVWLKRATPQNIVIGGGAGATAPLIAWAAVTGTVGLTAVLLAAIVFFWTPPHFWALALYRRDDYQRAGIPMLPVTHGEEETRRQIMLYTACLVPITLAPLGIGAAGALYGVVAAVLGGMFLWQAWKLLVTAEMPRAVRLFRFSILYLFVLFVALGVDAVVGGAGRAGAGRAGGSAPVGMKAHAIEPAAGDTSAVPVGPPIEVDLSARPMAGLPVTVEPLVPKVLVRRGERAQVEYRFTNKSARAVEFQAVHRVTPASADPMFHKQVCFCFERQKLAPFASATMPVRFVVDAALPDSVTSLALDYALYELAPVTTR